MMMFLDSPKRTSRPSTIEELTKCVRNHYQVPPREKYKADHYVSRTENDVIRKSTKAPFPETFHRRLQNLKVGHFSDVYSPYKALGEPQLDPKQVIMDVLGESMSGAPGIEYAPQTSGQQQQVDVKAAKHEMPEGEKSVTIEEFNARKKQCYKAGKEDIQKALQNVEKCRNAVKAGQPYCRITRPVSSSRPRTQVVRLQDLSRDKDSMNGMELQSLSSHFLDLAIPSEGLSFTRLLATPEPENIKEVFNSRNTSLALPIIRRRDYHILTSQKNPRKVVVFYNKIQCIYSTLCCLYNIKSKHLRMRSTLTPATLKEIRQDPFLQQSKDKDGKQDGTATSNPGSAMSTSKSSANPLLSQQTMSRLDPNLPAISSGSRAGMSRRSISMLRQGGPSARVTENKRARKLTMTTPIHAKMETWDDLLNAHRKRPRERKLPLWQQQLPLEKLITKSSADDMKGYSHLLNRIKMDELLTKEALRNQLLRDLIKIEEERSEKARLCMEQLNTLKSLWEEQAKIKQDHVLEVEAKEDHQVTPWYEMLSNECHNLACDLNAEVLSLLVKISKFAHMDLANLPAAREKLCLFTLSLPVMEILTIEMQSAIKFVLKEVIHHSTDQLDIWLHSRNLYVI